MHRAEYEARCQTGSYLLNVDNDSAALPLPYFLDQTPMATINFPLQVPAATAIQGRRLLFKGSDYSRVASDQGNTVYLLQNHQCIVLTMESSNIFNAKFSGKFNTVHGTESMTGTLSCMLHG